MYIGSSPGSTSLFDGLYKACSYPETYPTLLEYIRLAMDKAIESALNNAALAKCPHDYWLDSKDVRDFKNLVGSSRVSVGKGDGATYSCNANFRIRVYDRNPVKKGAAIGATSGVAAGAVIGGIAGSVVPVVGNVVGVVAGGIIGGISGLLGGGLAGAGAGAGIGGAVSNENAALVTAREVFQLCPGFREEGDTVYCTIP